jgi:heme/copper-type cytochrome/quinol oxidase subunit 2
LSEASIWDILFSFAQWLLAIFGIVATLAFIISGFQYLLSAGDEDAIDTAKRNMTYAVVGVIVALGSYVIITAVSRALNAVPLF